MSADPQQTIRNHEKLITSLAKAADKYPKPQSAKFSYGTAGFRMKASALPPVIFRTALLAILRSKKKDGATIGVMITASHNPAEDNGVKIVDPNGEMLEQSWEAHATALSNCPTTDSLLSTFTTIASHAHVDLDAPCAIVYGRDTRPSGEALVEALESGFAPFQDTFGNVSLNNLGVVTTPVLHHVVRATNDKSGLSGKPTKEGYYERMASAFKTIIGNRGSIQPLRVDCANGVGALALKEAEPFFQDTIQLIPTNDNISNPSLLNSQSGADFVKTRQALPPSIAEAGYLKEPNSRGCSFDGDADRLIYYYLRNGKDFRLLDGDKIAVMVAMYLGDLVAKIKGSEAKIGVVQTAYANGSSTRHLATRGIPIQCVPTGVKHLHHAAQSYDIGVYFEANGHGTVLFAEPYLETLRSQSSPDSESATAVKTVLAFSELVNQAVGDALSDLLLVEAVLCHRGWGAAEWDGAYEDLPNRLLKVEVPDRTIFITYDAERKLEKPEGLQAKIDAAAGEYEQGRAFVRPSGTEDCVRVYAEAKEDADGLATKVADLVRSYGGA